MKVKTNAEIIEDIKGFLKHCPHIECDDKLCMEKNYKQLIEHLEFVLEYKDSWNNHLTKNYDQETK